MQENNMLYKQQQISAEVRQANAPRNVQMFGFNKLGFTSFDDLIRKSSEELNVEYEIFFSNSLDTQHGYMKVVGGKICKIIPLLEIRVVSSVPVIDTLSTT